MKKSKWIEGVRDRLCDILIECDSNAAINDTEMTSFQRQQLQRKVKEAIRYIDFKVEKPVK